jgi:hypothetical protein
MMSLATDRSLKITLHPLGNPPCQRSFRGLTANSPRHVNVGSSATSSVTIPYSSCRTRFGIRSLDPETSSG